MIAPAAGVHNPRFLGKQHHQKQHQKMQSLAYAVEKPELTQQPQPSPVQNGHKGDKSCPAISVLVQAKLRPQQQQGEVSRVGNAVMSISILHLCSPAGVSGHLYLCMAFLHVYIHTYIATHECTEGQLQQSPSSQPSRSTLICKAWIRPVLPVPILPTELTKLLL